MRTRHTAACAACALALIAGAALAAAGSILKDPTRPPAGVVQSGSEGARESVPVVQSVIITPGMRAAVIDGRRVEVGERLGDARIVSITEGEVTLESGKRRETLRLYPQVQIKTNDTGGLPPGTSAAGAHGTSR